MTTRTTVATADKITMSKALPFLSGVESKSGMHIENYIQKQIVQNIQEKKNKQNACRCTLSNYAISCYFTRARNNQNQ